MIEGLVSGATHSSFSVRGTYTPATAGEESVSVEVVLDLGVSPRDGGTSTYQDEADFADFLTSEITPEKGGTLTDVEGYGGKAWRIGRRESDDGYIVRHQIMPIEVDDE